MAKLVSDCYRIMRTLLGRRNESDQDANDATMLSYLNDFVHITMSDDVKLFEQFGTLEFTITTSNTTGVFTFNDVGADDNFVNLEVEGFITLTTPATSSVSWNPLCIYQKPAPFFQKWGVHNESILTKGFPSDMLYYGNEFTFRTIQDNSYDVIIYGYKENADFSSVGDPALPFDFWLRYLAYGAARNYATDYNVAEDRKQNIDKGFARERALMLTRTHNQKTQERGAPNF